MKLESDGVTYHVRVAGEGEPLLLLHGFTGSMRTWEFLISYLKNKYKLIMPDIIGHGRTTLAEDPNRYEIRRVASDMKNILVQLNAAPVHILGYSMGGRLALSMACLYPEITKSLILESSSPGLKTEEERVLRRQRDDALAQRIEEHGVTSFVNEWENISLFSTQKRLSVDIRQSLRKQRLRNSPTGLANSLRGMGTGSQPSWWSSLADLRCSVLLLTGELDEKYCEIAKKMISILPVGKWITVQNAGHTIHMEEEKKFVTIVNEFLCSQSK